MKLQTQIPLEKQSGNQIDYHSKLLLLGSCFSENIGEKFDYFKFNSLQNPFGILFHPKAIEKLIYNALHEKKYSESDIFFHNGQWHCYDAHSKLSRNSKEELFQTLNNLLEVTTQQLHSATHIIITLGTAWLYKNYETNLPVANCHKVPQKEFVKELLSVEEVTNSITMMVAQIHQVNPKVVVIFTVSPVRHIKDGFVKNTQSKAHLISAIHQFLNRNASLSEVEARSLSGVEAYFPSYEIMLDELRDYRFYSEDMLHPSQTAINYIWEKFQKVWIAPKAENTMNAVEEIQKALQHRPFNPDSESHKSFLQNLISKKENLKNQFPHIKF